MTLIEHLRGWDEIPEDDSEAFRWLDLKTAEAADELEFLQQQLAACERQRDTAWAQAHRLALELECLLLDTKDNAVVSKWWDSGMEALSEYQELQPGAKEDAEAWAAIRKAGV